MTVAKKKKKKKIEITAITGLLAILTEINV